MPNIYVGEILFRDLKSGNYLYFGINILIFIDFLLVVYLLSFNVSPVFSSYIVAFDVFVCIILIADFIAKFIKADDRSSFLKHELVYIISSIPLELIFPTYFIAFRLVLILKLLELTGFVKRYFASPALFLENTKIDKVLGWVFFVIILFTIALHLLDSSLGLFDSLWYVIVTVTTVGYGDVTPNTFTAKIISLMLLVMGILIFSTLTGAISSYFNDKILNIDTDVEEGLEAVDKKLEDLAFELDEVKVELELVHRENRRLQEKLDELLKR